MCWEAQHKCVWKGRQAEEWQADPWGLWEKQQSHTVRLRLSEGHGLKMGKVEEEGVQRLPGIHTLCTCTQVCLCLSHYITHAYMQACTHFRNLFSKSNTICMVNCCHVSTEQSGKALIEFKRVMFWNTEGLMKELKLHYDQEQFYTPS